MKIIALHKPVNGIIFDIDQTLYNNREYYDSQKRLLIERVAGLWQKPFSKTLQQLEEFRQLSASRHSGQEPTLSDTLLEFGITMEQNIAWREELFQPEKYLSSDKELIITFTILTNKCQIVAVTNNPARIGYRTLEVLGIREFFLTVVGLDTTGISKPHLAPFEKAARYMQKSFRELVSIGDRLEVDLELPVQAGMSGILVEYLEDVYRLPEVLG